MTSVALSRRALHFVFKVSNRKDTISFYKDVLGMNILRHEEFEEGCKAACNGPFDGRWSKSMVGYGPEDNHFVVELTYNYGIGSYAMGNDFQGITIKSKDAFKQAVSLPSCVKLSDHICTIKSPCGYKFHVVDEDINGDPVVKCSLASSDLKITHAYWVNTLGMKCFEQSDQNLILGYSNDQCKLEFVKMDKVDHAKAYGRIAFSTNREELPAIESTIKQNNQTILTPLVSLDTPGKATVEVVILADPDGHEICFVGDEAFRELSQLDPKADDLLDKAIQGDTSDEWYAKKGKSKQEG